MNQSKTLNVTKFGRYRQVRIGTDKFRRRSVELPFYRLNQSRLISLYMVDNDYYKWGVDTDSCCIESDEVCLDKPHMAGVTGKDSCRAQSFVLSSSLFLYPSWKKVNRKKIFFLFSLLRHSGSIRTRSSEYTL
jgi:hypothetical protein